MIRLMIGLYLVHVQVLEDAIIKALQALLQEEFTADVKESWEMFYQCIHLLPRYQ